MELQEPKTTRYEKSLKTIDIDESIIQKSAEETEMIIEIKTETTNDKPYITNKTKPVDLTTARFRMLVNAEDYAQNYEAKIDDNYAPQRYSMSHLVKHFEEIAYHGFDLTIIRRLIHSRRQFRRNYFFNNIINVTKPCSGDTDLVVYQLGKNPKQSNYIDRILQWYSVFPSKTDDENDSMKLKLINEEKIHFTNYLQWYYRQLLLEFYEIVEYFPNRMIKQCVELIENHLKQLINNCFINMKRMNEVCRKCGELFPNKTYLINHHDFNGCRLPPTHRCQCGQFFMTHADWICHCLQTTMSCPTFVWHLWRFKRTLINEANNKWLLNNDINKSNDKNNDEQYDYYFICDGCQHCYGNFLQFWHHLCYCPFFYAYLIGNCPQCTQVTKDEFYVLHNVQKFLETPHSDYVGIKIIEEWAEIKELQFQVKLADNDEPEYIIENE